MTYDVLVDRTALDTSSRFTGTGRFVAELGRALEALSDRELDWVHARRVDTQSAEARVLHTIILRASAGLHSQGLIRLPIGDRAAVTLLL